MKTLAHGLSEAGEVSRVAAYDRRQRETRARWWGAAEAGGWLCPPVGWRGAADLFPNGRGAILIKISGARLGRKSEQSRPAPRSKLGNSDPPASETSISATGILFIGKVWRRFQGRRPTNRRF